MKKTLYIKEGLEECQKVKDFFLNRKDVNIITSEELLEKNDIKVTPTLVVETWEEVLIFTGFEKIEEYLNDEPTPDYPCVCSDVEN
ncbi:MAG: hypothetical protein ACRC7F_08675 [Cetobacterium sp.]|uniref:hypothetical protein n=1 Tax=unclassified Cetobacterium TaxID=2630983 RepID=UPI00064571F1|nr:MULTISPECIES: hypothetical protein [unclassified Cetobacterium]